MGFLDSLLASAGPQVRDFMQRYESGSPLEGYSDQEASQHYDKVSDALSPEQFRGAAEQALARFSPQQRAELLNQLQQNAQQQNVTLPPIQPSEGGSPAPGLLASLFSGVTQQQPNLLQKLLGGVAHGKGNQSSQGEDSSSPFASPLAKAALAGIAVFGLKHLMASKPSGF